MFPSKVEQNNLKATIAASYNKLYGQFSSNELIDIGNYKIVKLIGEGSFGKVYLANHRLTHQKVVLKTGNKNDPNVVREVFYHRQFDFPHITKLYEVIVTESKVWMALEYCPGKELYEYLLMQHRISLEESGKLFAQIVSAVYYAHSLQCVHRDLKLENILLDKKGRAKITDFGFTRECATKTMLETVCGTTVYMAPELIERKSYDGFKIDIWSLGVILYTMIHGTMPFDEEDETKTKWKIVNEEPFYNDDVVSKDAKDLISQLLCKDPSQRPQLSQVLAHPFLQPYGSSLLEASEKIIKRQRQSTTNFHSKLEKRLLKKLKQSGFDTNAIKHSVIKKKCDSLSGMWFLLLEREMKREIAKYPRRSRSVLSVRKVFESTPSIHCHDDDFLNHPSNNVVRTTSLKKIMSRRSVQNENVPPSPLSKMSNQVPLNRILSNDQQHNGMAKEKKNNIFTKMSKFFKSKKQNNHPNDTSISQEVFNIQNTDKRKHKTSSNDSHKVSPKRSPKNEQNGEALQEPSIQIQQPPSPRNNRLKIEEPVLKKFKSNTSSEISRQTSLGNYDSELDLRSNVIVNKSPQVDSTADVKSPPPIRARPSSMLSQHSEISNDTYNSEYSTDGNQSSYKTGNSTNAGITRSTNSNSITVNSNGNDNSSISPRAFTKRSMSIMSSASSASERSSRTDSFYDITTASSPMNMDIRAMNGPSSNGGTSRADSAFPRANNNSPWFIKRGKSPIGRRGRLPHRNINRQLMKHSSAAAQSVIQEESSFDDEAGIVEGDEDYNSLENHEVGNEQVLREDSTTPSKSSPLLSSVAIIDNKPVVFPMARSFSEGSNWSHNDSEDHNDITPGPLGSATPDDYEDIGVADDEDNSEEYEQDAERVYRNETKIKT